VKAIYKLIKFGDNDMQRQTGLANIRVNIHWFCFL